MSLSLQELENLRKNYALGRLDEADCPADPMDMFQRWLKEALTSECDEPNAFTLSTVSGGRPRGRVVLLKGLVGGELVFYTNYDSPKGKELESAGHAAATFLWLPLQRQVRVEGTIRRAPADMSDAYFASRPHDSQIGALASPQGQVVRDRAVLERSFQLAEEQYPPGTPVPRPANWGGLMIAPTYWEFWQGRRSRLHDRIAYQLTGEVWKRMRLAP